MVINNHKSKLIVDSLKDVIKNNEEIDKFICDYKKRFLGFDNELFNLFFNGESKNIYQLKNDATNLLFAKCNNLKLIDKYDIYKEFDENWSTISIDLELINDRGNIDICREIEDIEVYNKTNKETIIKGKQGKVLPFDLIKKELYHNEYVLMDDESKKLNDLENEYSSILNELSPESKTEILSDKENNEDEPSVDSKKLKAKYNEIIESLSSDETIAFSEYIKLKDKAKLEYQNQYKNLPWPTDTEKNKKGIYTNTVIKNKIKAIKAEINIDEDEEDYKFKKMYLLSNEISEVSQKIKNMNKELDSKIINDIETLNDETIYKLLKEKWIVPVVDGINNLPIVMINDLLSKLNAVIKRYSDPLKKTNEEIEKTEKSIISMLDDIVGNEFDIEALREFKKILGGDINE